MIFADTGDIKPVAVRRLRPDPFALNILRTLEDNEFANALLHGGALRDRYMGADARIKDYDIWVNFGTSAGTGKISEKTADFFVQKIMGLFPGAALSGDVLLEHTTSRSQSWARIEFSWQGRQIDLFLTTVPLDLDSKALMSDAPINAVAMDARGRIRAHPHFEEHARGRFYAPLPCIEDDVAAARFAYLRGKITGLKPPAPPPAPGPQP